MQAHTQFKRACSLVERVLVDLISNAIRRNPPDRQVLLTASPDHDHVELRIADHGPGRDDRTDLAVARGLTVAMNGTFTLSNTGGGGLTVTLTLPESGQIAHG